MGQQAVSYTESGLSKLFWYDKYSGISYRAESNLDQDALVKVFKDSIEMHPPIYEPTWLPEGYVLYDTYIDGGNCDLSYYNEKTGSIIGIECSDLGITDRLFIDGTGPSREMIINGTTVTVYCGQDNVKGTVLVMVDEIHNMAITMYTGMIDPDLVTSIAENLTIVNSVSRFIP